MENEGWAACISFLPRTGLEGFHRDHTMQPFFITHPLLSRLSLSVAVRAIFALLNQFVTLVYITTEAPCIGPRGSSIAPTSSAQSSRCFGQ